MRQLRAWLLRLLGVAGVGRRDDEIAEELETHRALLEAEYRRAGAAPDDARRRAAATFGSLASAESTYRERRGLAFVEHGIRDSVYAIRSLRRSPALVVSMVLVLGLGIGLTTAIATIFHSIVWQGLPVPEPDRVVKVSLAFAGEVSRHVSGGEQGFSYPELTAYRAATRALEGVAGVDAEHVTWQNGTGMRSLSAALVTADYFRALHVTPAAGRLLTADDERQPVAVVSYHFWQDTLGGHADALGRALVLDRTAYAVVGVADERFAGTDAEPVDVWLPLEAASTLGGNAGALTERNYSWLEVIGRLAPHASMTTATAEAAVVASQFDRDNPGRRTTMNVERASRLEAGVWASRERTMVVARSAAAGVMIAILLLICGSNVAGLLLARGATRQREIAVRVALGASGGRITQQLAAEVLVIALASALVGVLVCTWTFRVMAIWLPIGALLGSLAPDARVFALALASAIGMAFVFGLAPALQAARVDCLAALKGEVVGPLARRSAMRLRRLLISMQVAVSVILLIGATLLGESARRVFSVNPGYATGALYVAELDRASVQASQPADGGAVLVRQMRDAVAGRPGIRDVGLTSIALFQGSGTNTARADNMKDPVQVRFNSVDAGYFQALGLTPIAGRFAEATEKGAVVVNASLARKFWGDERAALDHLLEIGGAGYAKPYPVRVVGVVPTVQTVDIGVPDAPTYYAPVENADAARFLIVRGDGHAPVPRVVLDTVRALDRDAFVTVRSVDDRLAVVTSPSRIGAALAGLLGMLALLVTAVGIHGIVAHAVIARTREVGIRLALGAPRAAVLRVVVGSSLRSVLAGALAGGALVALVAWSFSAGVRTALFGMNPLDPTACLAAAACLAAVVFVAAYLPARRALGVAPLDALRHDA